MQCIAGLLSPSSGSIQLPDKLQLSYMFQSYRDALFPRMTVEQNICYPLLQSGISSQKSKEIVQQLLEELHIFLPLHKYPYQLSGGQQQLSNIVRAIITNPDILLLDEPFSALDYETKRILYSHLQNIFLRRPMGILMISHDIDEALLLSQNIYLLSANPLKVTESHSYPISYPRDLSYSYSQAYIQNKQHILSSHSCIFGSFQQT